MRKTRWSKVYESSEEELVAFLQERSIQAAHISIEAYDEQAYAAAPHEVSLWCAEGSAIVQSGATSMSLQPGDVIRISPDTDYSVHAGISGCAFYQQGQ